LSKSPYSTLNIYNCILTVSFLFDVFDVTEKRLNSKAF